VDSLEPQKLYGPDDFVQRLIAGRNSESAKELGGRAAISDEGLRRLISLVYYASQLPEEGRFPRFRVYCSYIAPPRDSSICWIKFRYELTSVDALRRLVPSIPANEAMLQIIEDGSKLFCVGIAPRLPDDILSTAMGLPWFNQSTGSLLTWGEVQIECLSLSDPV
jgi:hypothetical protein